MGSLPREMLPHAIPLLLFGAISGVITGCVIDAVLQRDMNNVIIGCAVLGLGLASFIMCAIAMARAVPTPSQDTQHG